VKYKRARARTHTHTHTRTGLIGAAGGYGVYLAALQARASVQASSQASAEDGIKSFQSFVEHAAQELIKTRPTAVNLEFAVTRQLKAMAALATLEERVTAAKATAQAIADEDAEFCARLGQHGVELIRDIHRKKQQQQGGASARVNILTHCNAGWLAFVDVGSATAPIYAAHDAGIPVHVFVDETRPRNQGASLTCWELGALTPNPTPCTLYPTPCTLHPTPYTLHPTPYTLHPTPYTLHPTPYTLHPVG
jgi:methylthioribose-1-phosphate isomerase